MKTLARAHSEAPIEVRDDDLDQAVGGASGVPGVSFSADDLKASGVPGVSVGADDLKASGVPGISVDDGKPVFQTIKYRSPLDP